MKTLTTFICCITLLCQVATAQNNSAFVSAKQEIENMLSGKEALSYEKAIFLMENAYYENTLDYAAYKGMLNFHTENIQYIIASNTTKTLSDFTPQLLNSAEKQKAKYDKALANWAIFTYLTDTTYFLNKQALLFHLPYSYSSADPLGTDDWRNTQVINLLDTKQGNCFALVSLFKILSERLKTEASICTAPGHVFIRHADDKGIKYFVELPTRSFPGLGTMETLTYTTDEATINNISMRTLDLQQSVALSLVYLAKGYEFKSKIKTDDFLIQCAFSALNYDSLNLNAMLLKAEVLEERVVQKNKTITQLQLDTEFKEYENLIAKLYKLGYREMPIEMKNILLSAMKGEENPEPFIDHTPKPFEHLGVKDDRYATLSWGMFEEMHEKKEKEKYSRIIFNTEKNKITDFVNADTLYNKYDFDPVVFALSIDPLARKYPNLSPYVPFNNNPVIYNDPDGRDFRYVVDDKAGTITVQTTIHVYGQDAASVAAKSQANADKLSNNPFTYKDENGKTWIVKIDAKFIENKSIDEKLSTDDFLAMGESGAEGVVSGFQLGDNILSTTNSPDIGNLETTKAFVSATKSEGTAMHVLGHFLGLDERYSVSADKSKIETDEGFEEDPMGYHPGTEMHPIHMINIAENYVGFWSTMMKSLTGQESGTIPVTYPDMVEDFEPSKITEKVEKQKQ